MDLTKQITLNGEVTAEQIAAWKADKMNANGLYMAISKDGKNVDYYRYPNRFDMNCAMAKAKQDSALDMFEELAELTHLGGSRYTLDNDKAFFGLSQELKTKMEGEKLTLEDL